MKINILCFIVIYVLNLSNIRIMAQLIVDDNSLDNATEATESSVNAVTVQTSTHTTVKATKIDKNTKTSDTTTVTAKFDTTISVKTKDPHNSGDENPINTANESVINTVKTTYTTIGSRITLDTNNVSLIVGQCVTECHNKSIYKWNCDQCVTDSANVSQQYYCCVFKDNELCIEECVSLLLRETKIIPNVDTITMKDEIRKVDQKLIFADKDCSYVNNTDPESCAIYLNSTDETYTPKPVSKKTWIIIGVAVAIIVPLVIVTLVCIVSKERMNFLNLRNKSTIGSENSSSSEENAKLTSNLSKVSQLSKDNTKEPTDSSSLPNERPKVYSTESPNYTSKTSTDKNVKESSKQLPKVSSNESPKGLRTQSASIKQIESLAK